MSKMVVIYHKADFDGIFCYQIAKKHFGDDARYIGWDYGDPVPEISANEWVYMMDVSIDELMSHPRLVWIDHHKTAMDKYYAKVNEAHCIDGVAACRLAWQFFLDDDDALPTKQDFIDRKVIEPYAVRLAGEFDVWDKRDPCADMFQYGLKATKLNDDLWERLLRDGYNTEEGIDDVLDAGMVAQIYADNQNADIIKAQGFTVHFEGKCFLALNTARCNSLAFLAGIDPVHDGCLSFNWTGEHWRVSLYGVPDKPELDFSPIAAKYGGGGHRQACGFITDTLPFLNKV